MFLSYLNKQNDDGGAVQPLRRPLDVAEWSSSDHMELCEESFEIN